MDPNFIATLVARFLHILAGALAIGVPIYMRFVLMPAMAQLEESQRPVLRDALAARWRMFVHLMILIFLATGFWTYLGAARWRQFDADVKSRYHMLFGIKFLLALAMFFISSALAGRAAAFAGMRASARTWVGVLILLGLCVLGIAGYMRFMPWPTTAPPG